MHFKKLYLNTKNAKDDEKSAADQNNVADRLEGCDEGFNYQLQPRSSADHSAGKRMMRIKRGLCMISQKYHRIQS